MGTWGPGLYQDDIAEEVREYYKDQLHRGKAGTEITKELIAQNEGTLSDPDDAPVFWFALADTQWNFGRLEDFVKEQALHYIRNGYDVKRWEAEDPPMAKKRVKVLEELTRKLLSSQPTEKKIVPYKLYRCKWKIGDVYAYQLDSEYAKENGMKGKYLYFVKVDEAVWYLGHNVPVVYFYRITGDHLLSLEELKHVDYIPQFFLPEVYKRDPERKKLYLLQLLSTSSRVIPGKRLTFIGTLQTVEHMDGEDPNPYEVGWKDFEKYIIDNFHAWNKCSPCY